MTIYELKQANRPNTKIQVGTSSSNVVVMAMGMYQSKPRDIDFVEYLRDRLGIYAEWVTVTEVVLV